MRLFRRFGIGGRGEGISFKYIAIGMSRRGMVGRGGRVGVKRRRRRERGWLVVK